MGIPVKVSNRLLMGREVATDVGTPNPDRRAWVIVVPIVDESAQWTHDSAGPGSEPRLTGQGARLSISGYQVIRVEVSSETLDRIRDDDLASDAVEIVRLAARNESELECALAGWVQDTNTLRHPGNVPNLSLVLFRLGRRLLL
jgi:hypothetical protein